jgi:hypothetical protein
MFYIAVPCGMVTEHFTDEHDPMLNPDHTVSRYGVGVMMRGSEIKDALMVDVMREERLRWDAEEIKRGPKPGPQVRAVSARFPSLDSTADLMGRLLQVPKEEADEVHRRHGG